MSVHTQTQFFFSSPLSAFHSLLCKATSPLVRHMCTHTQMHTCTAPTLLKPCPAENLMTSATYPFFFFWGPKENGIQSRCIHAHRGVSDEE